MQSAGTLESRPTIKDTAKLFSSHEFNKFCEKNNVQKSMSRASCPYDNAPMERYYNMLKNEYINLFTYRTKEELESAVRKFAYAWYNHVCPHTYNQA